jgi:xylulokinase
VSEYLLGIDMGTGSTKGVLARPDGTIVATASRAHAMSLPRPGWAEMDAERDWWGDFVEVCRELVQAAPAGAIKGVCVSGLGPCLLVCDERHTPLRAGILYGIDMRATREIDELTERYGEDAIVERCGKELSTQAVGPKLLWVRNHEPDVWQRTKRWYSAHSFVVARLTGEYVLDHHTASQCDPLYDLAARDWHREWAEDIAPGLALPRLAWSGDVVGTIHAEAAALTGLPAGTPVTAGTVDAWAEGFSAGVRAPGDLMLMYGSTMFFVQVLERALTHPGLWTTAGVSEGSFTLAAGMATSGSLTTWVRELTGDAPFEDLVREAGESPPGADGLLVLPYFAGERTPIFDPQARGVVAGLTLRHRRGHLFRAVYEGIAFGIRQILEVLDAAAAPAARIVAVGGGTQGGLWTQIVSDVTGREQLLPAQTIGASYGDALLAGIGVGLVTPDTDWSKQSARVEPEPRHRALYDELYDAYCRLYPATKPLVHRLAAIQEHGSTGYGAGAAEPFAEASAASAAASERIPSRPVHDGAPEPATAEANEMTAST